MSARLLYSANTKYQKESAAYSFPRLGIRIYKSNIEPKVILRHSSNYCGPLLLFFFFGSSGCLDLNLAVDFFLRDDGVSPSCDYFHIKKSWYCLGVISGYYCVCGFWVDGT